MPVGCLPCWLGLPMHRGVRDTGGFLVLYVPQNHRLLRGRSLGEIIEDEVRNVTNAAAAVMGLPDVGTITAHSSSSFLTSSFEDRCLGAERGEGPN
jgi:hypothetical protein